MSHTISNRHHGQEKPDLLTYATFAAGSACPRPHVRHRWRWPLDPHESSVRNERTVALTERLSHSFCTPEKCSSVSNSVVWHWVLRKGIMIDYTLCCSAAAKIKYYCMTAQRWSGPSMSSANQFKWKSGWAKAGSEIALYLLYAARRLSSTVLLECKIYSPRRGLICHWRSKLMMTNKGLNRDWNMNLLLITESTTEYTKHHLETREWVNMGRIADAA